MTSVSSNAIPNRIPAPKPTEADLKKFAARFNDWMQEISLKVYGTIQYSDLAATTQGEIEDNVEQNGLTFEDVQITKEDGLRIDTTLTSGETTAEVYFSAKGTQIGLYRTSDDKQLWGGKLLADGRVVTVTNVIVDPDGDDNAYYQMSTDEDGVWLDFVHGTHSGTGPESDPDLENPPITAWEKLIRIGADVVPGWVPGEYSDAIYVMIRAILRGAFSIYGDQIYISALDPDTEESKCGFSFDAERDNRIRSWGHIIPTENGVYTLGSPGLVLRYKRLYCTESVDVDSDARLKQDIKDLSPDLIFKLRPREYRLKADPSRLRFGLVAQEVKAALDECGIEDADLYGDENPDSLSLRYEQFIAPLIATVQQQQKRIEALEQKLANT